MGQGLISNFFIKEDNFDLQIGFQSRLQIYLSNMKIVALALSLLVIATAFQVQKYSLVAQPVLQGINWPFTICGTGKWTIESVVFGSIPSRNLNDNIDMIGTATDSVSFSKVDLDVKLNGVFLHAQSADFVASFDSGDAVAYRYKNFIPGFAPAGTYTLTFNFVNQSNKPQGCVSMSFKL